MMFGSCTFRACPSQKKREQPPSTSTCTNTGDCSNQDWGRVAAPVFPNKGKQGGSGHNAGITVLQNWENEGKVLKQEVNEATEAHNKAIEALFSIFESILGVVASGRWDGIVAKICVRGSTTATQRTPTAEASVASAIARGSSCLRFLSKMRPSVNVSICFFI